MWRASFNIESILFETCNLCLQENKAKSRYEEDALINNHTCVWGSWWKDGTWGYACCHQTVKNSYCTGKAGDQAKEEVAAQMIANMEARAKEADAELLKWVGCDISHGCLRGVALSASLQDACGNRWGGAGR